MVLQEVPFLHSFQETKSRIMAKLIPLQRWARECPSFVFSAYLSCTGVIRKCSRLLIVGLSLSMYSTRAYATAISIGDMATNLSQSYTQFGSLIVGLSYICGIGFFVGGLYKYKMYRENQTQIPFTAPFALLMVGVAMFFLPGFVVPTGATVFGTSDVTAGGFLGNGVTGLPGG